MTSNAHTQFMSLFIGSVFRIHTFFLPKIIIKRIQMKRLNYFHFIMPDCRNDPSEKKLIPSEGCWLKIIFSTLYPYIIDILLKCHPAVKNNSLFTFFIKHNSLTVKLFFDLLCRHARLGSPCHVLHQFFAVGIVSAGTSYKVTFSTLFYTRRINYTSLPFCRHIPVTYF